MTRLLYAAVVAVIWVLAWGSPSPGNVVGGLAVAVLLMVVAPDTWPPPRRVRIRPLAIVHLLAYVVVKAIESNVLITIKILSRRPDVHTGVLAIPLPRCPDGLVTLIANTLALTPGTVPLEVTREPTVIYAHVIVIRNVEASRAEIFRLAVLAYRAFATEEALAALEASLPGQEVRT